MRSLVSRVRISSFGSHSPAWRKAETAARQEEAPRTFFLVRGRLSVSDSTASGFRDHDFAFVLIGTDQHPPRFSIPESFFSDAFWDRDGRLIVELDGNVRLMISDL